MKAQFFFIFIILCLSSCSNLKHLDAFDGYQGQPRKVEIESYKVFEENGRQAEKFSYKIVLVYDKVGRKVKENFFKSDGSPSIAGTSFSYNKTGNMTAAVMYNLDGTINTKDQYKYNKYGQVIEQLHTNQRDTIKTVLVFDRKKRTEVTRAWYKDGSFKEYAVRKYDKDWVEQELTSFDDLGNQTSRIVFEHDKNGNTTGLKWYNSNDELISISEFSYNSKNDRVRGKKYHLKDGDTIKISTEKYGYHYDAYGNMKEHHLFRNNDLLMIKRYNYTY